MITKAQMIEDQVRANEDAYELLMHGDDTQTPPRTGLIHLLGVTVHELCIMGEKLDTNFRIVLEVVEDKHPGLKLI